MYIHTFTDTPGGSTGVSHASPSPRVHRRRRDGGYSGYSGCGLRPGWHLAAALQEPVQWLFKKRLRGAERKVRESVSPVSMDEYTRWLYHWPTRSAGAADTAKQVDRVGCCRRECLQLRAAHFGGRGQVGDVAPAPLGASRVSSCSRGMLHIRGPRHGRSAVMRVDG